MVHPFIINYIYKQIKPICLYKSFLNKKRGLVIGLTQWIY